MIVFGCTKGSIATAPHTIDSVHSYDSTFTDSTSVLTRQNTIESLIGDRKAPDSVSGDEEVLQDMNVPSMFSARTGTKMRELVNPHEDYLQRWTQMKQKRDVCMLREERKDARKELLHNFKRLVVNSEAYVAHPMAPLRVR